MNPAANLQGFRDSQVLIHKIEQLGNAASMTSVQSDQSLRKIVSVLLAFKRTAARQASLSIMVSGVY